MRCYYLFENRGDTLSYIKFDPDDNFYFHHGASKRVMETGASWPHYHSLYEIYFLLEGNCTYFINNKVYNVQSGDIVIVPDGFIHHSRYDNTNHSRILINCTSRYIPASIRSYIASENYLYRNPSVTDEIKNILEKIENEYTLKDSLSEEIISCHTHSLFYLLIRNADTCLDVDSRNKVIEQAVAYIRENFASDVSLSFIAEMFSVSPEHFSRMFKKETGLGFSKYLNSLRLQHAEQLLRTTRKPNITKIAESCGFEDSNYFSKKFKEVYGISPKKVQNKGKGGEK